MSYAVYKTKGFISGGRDQDETTRSIEIFTEDFGFLRVKALGIRKMGSKLRAHLRTFAKVEVSLVRGRGDWRLVGAEEYSPPPPHHESQIFARAIALVTRLAPVEGSEKELFSELDSFRSAVGLTKEEYLPDLERIFALRTFSLLGYLASLPESVQFIYKDRGYSTTALSASREHRSMLALNLRQAMQASGL
ncbi:MAG: recombination protein O N-terminal domain-containing protein [Patescibacteria group bacterium]